MRKGSSSHPIGEKLGPFCPVLPRLCVTPSCSTTSKSEIAELCTIFSPLLSTTSWSKGQQLSMADAKSLFCQSPRDHRSLPHIPRNMCVNHHQYGNSCIFSPCVCVSLCIPTFRLHTSRCRCQGAASDKRSKASCRGGPAIPGQSC